MKQSYLVSVALVVACLVWALVSCETQTRTTSYNEVQIKRQVSNGMTMGSKPEMMKQPSHRQKREESHKITADEQMSQNEIGGEGEKRITIEEPIKSMMQATARFALVYTRLPRLFDIEATMKFLNSVAYQLSKPKVLIKALKAFAISIATLMATLFFFPGVHKFAETVINDPLRAMEIDRYIHDGLHESYMIDALGSKTDETLSRVGLQDSSCRQRSLCHMGVILKCSLPLTSSSIIKFAREHLSNSSLNNGPYAQAFRAGFVDENCTGVGLSETGRNSQNCLGNLFSTFLKDVRDNDNN